MRQRLEWQQELDNLRELEQQIPAINEEGEDNHEAIRAQINVIDTLMTHEDIYDMYEGDDFVLNAALDAGRWLREDDEPPSDHWQAEITTNV